MWHFTSPALSVPFNHSKGTTMIDVRACSLQTVLNRTNPFYRKRMVWYGMGDVDPNHMLHVNLQRSYSFSIVTLESKKWVRGPFCAWISTRERSSRHPWRNIALIRSARRKRPFVLRNACSQIRWVTQSNRDSADSCVETHQFGSVQRASL